MKRWMTAIGAFVFLFSAMMSQPLADDGGEMGIFGGISGGRSLPFTLEKYVASNQDPATDFPYKEFVFLSGVPIECEGTITVEKDVVDYNKKPEGTYQEKYTITATNTLSKASLNREITFDVSYRMTAGAYSKQIIRNAVVTGWQETIVIGDKTYTLDEIASSFSKSSVEDVTPGVSYYDTIVSYYAEYTVPNSADVVVLVDGNIYGFQQFWAKVESQKFSLEISHDGGKTFDTVVELKPFLEAKKTIYFDATAPYAMSFGGTYNQRLERQSTLSYEVLASNQTLTEVQKTGQALIRPANSLEKLPIPAGLSFIKGHWAEEDLKKLYSLEIFTEVPHSGMQYEAMTRGEFVKALCLGLNVSTKTYDTITRKSPQQFDDVPTSHPLYKYIMAAYDAKMIQGKGTSFGVADPITRQEAFVMLIRVIGLEELESMDTPQTSYTDDAAIATWARKEISAGSKIGIIRGNDKGQVEPKRWITKVQAAAIINRLVDYLREEIATQYK